MLIKSLNRYLVDDMGMKYPLIITPESLCRDRDNTSIRQICEYVIACSVSCDDRDEFINSMQQLSTDSQAMLMNIIKNVTDSIDKEGESGNLSFTSLHASVFIYLFILA